MTDGLTNHVPLVYERSEAYKKGWVLGFYDCRSEEGSRNGNRVDVAHFPGHPSEDEIGDFLCGYVDAVVSRMTDRRAHWTGYPAGRRHLCAA